MSSPALDLYQRHRLTVHDFHRMGEAGILPVEGRLELIEGEIIAKAPVGSRHAHRYPRQHVLRAGSGGPRYCLRSQPHHPRGALRARAGSGARPTAGRFLRAALPRADEVLLIVEVADTTLRCDREIKIPLYARHGIPEVFIDVEGRTLTVFETPADGRYRNERRVRPSGAACAQGAAGGRGGSVATLRNGLRGGLEWPNRS